ncbi:hypothetical protein ZYGR_0AD00160 [Zygosaccharomyces rouxii]|uniref:ZYRO0G06314p n=2 Tax=Zygosaccharomyces rouxii TaxID=4956 RepID=C5DZQ2_ZYGRC|nr:uncharacterized protein ZYRO0G06314g [Zygosaccharomyces rouxii]AAR88366.1 YHR121W protein [Zygosaccharomyces rouxii]KAH9202334.1 YHR121W protein [Zygosaccharomyces rouxii]GAV50833.1 hypothetical protein ZYGR_0AD00160 [Zygosaccharomyces rouxii]CAR29336.1 ZYRO0G06314p [Zygosaccharomyces rouxii]
MSISLENILGFKVKVVNVLDVVTEGKVYSFNSSNNTLTLQTSKKVQQPQSFKVIKCSFIKNLEVIGERPSTNLFKKQPIKPAYVHVDRVNQLLQEKMKESAKKNELSGKGVSSEGQFLFDMAYKTVSDTRWVDKNIVVLDSVEIFPPYKPENIKLINGSKAEAVTMVQRILQRGWQKLNESEETKKGG